MDEYWCRQVSLVSPRLRSADIVVAGVGTVGSWTALALVRTGARLWLYDPDTVGPENIGCQAYRPEHIGQHKVLAMAELLNGFPVFPYTERFPFPDRPENPAVVVSCVDSFAERRRVAEWAANNGVWLFIDTRMGGLTGVVIPVCGEDGYGDYLDHLPADEDIPPMACGAEGTAFVGMWLASRVTAEVNEAAYHRPVRPTFWHIGGNLNMGDRREVRHHYRPHTSAS